MSRVYSVNLCSVGVCRWPGWHGSVMGITLHCPPSDRNSAAQPHHSLVAGALFAGMWRPERSQSTFNLRFCQAVKLVAGGAMLDVETNCCSAWDNTNLMLVNIRITTPCTVIVFSTLDYRTATAFNWPLILSRSENAGSDYCQAIK